MNCKIVYSLFGLSIVMLATTAFGQSTNMEIKTPPMRDTDVYGIPLKVHIDPRFDPTPGTAPVAGWAGARLKLHIVDLDNEIDIDRVVSHIGDSAGNTQVWEIPFGPRSQNEISVPLWFTAWHPNAQQSGIEVPASETRDLFWVDVHAKNTDPQFNSDVDATFMLWNIWHLRGGLPGSQIIGLQPSDYVYANPGTDPIQFSEIPTAPPEVGQGTWIHLIEPKTFHTFGGPGSFFFATMATVGTIGIEHVPEPAAAVFLVGGLACTVMALRARRKRRALVG